MDQQIFKWPCSESMNFPPLTCTQLIQEILRMSSHCSKDICFCNPSQSLQLVNKTKYSSKATTYTPIISQSSITLCVMSEDPRTLSIPKQSIECSYLNAVPIFTLVYIPMFSGAIWSSTLWALCQSTQNTPLVSLVLPTSWEDPTSHPGSEEGWSMQVGLV